MKADAKQRTKRLRQLMTEHDLDAKAIGDMVDRSAQTVRSWACKYPERAIPKLTLELLELKLKAKE